MEDSRLLEGVPGLESVRGGVTVRALGGLALWLGVIGFGGGFAVANRIRRAVVQERRWISDAVFLEYFAVAGALPGTTATNLLTMLGSRLAGKRGAAVCAVGFLLPSVALMIAFGAEYDRLRGVSALGTFLDGMSYATVGVVAAVAVDMRRTAVKTRIDLLLAVLTAAAIALRVLSLLEVVAGAGLVGAFALRPAVVQPSAPEPELEVETFPPASSKLSGVMLPVVLLFSSGSIGLFVVFARIGIATFGGGFAMIPSIEHEVVSVRGWLTEHAFNDAMVLGQVTPGPIAIAATFIGYRVAGWTGAAAATLGMFGPPFVLSLVVERSLAVFRSNPVVRGFLRGVSPAVVGVIAAAAFALWRTSVHTPLGAGIAVVTFAILARSPGLSPLVPLTLGGIANALVA